MKRNNTSWHPVPAATLDWAEPESGEGAVPSSTRFGDVYYSRDNGLEESRHVFLAGNDLPGRWQGAEPGSFCIAETGFGTGLNFLLTWGAWRDSQEPRPTLHYLSVEKYPLAAGDMARALSSWPELAPLADELMACYPGLVPGQHRLVLDAGRVTLDLWWEDAGEALQDLASGDQPIVDAWYLDGFAPSRNASMWQASLWQAMAALSRPGATFSTFTAAGEVRRGLAAAGFAVRKVAGYGRKRECLRGSLAAPAQSNDRPSQTPWDMPQQGFPVPDRVLVLGAGLAGCTVAAALARRGIRVTLLDRGPVAGESSGNDQGILYTRLSPRHSALTDFAQQSYRFAASWYAALFRDGVLTQGQDGALCGCFHQSDRHREMDTLAETLDSVPEFARVVDATEASNLLGVEQFSAGYWFPGSGWLRPGSVCHALVRHPCIEVLENCGDVQLQREGDQWVAVNLEERLGTGTCAVIATGASVKSVPGLEWLPVQLIRGQTTQLPVFPDSRELRAALCHEGYIAPNRAGEHCIGATFVLQDESGDLRVEEHRSNLDHLAAAVPAWGHHLEGLEISTLEGRVGWRCASPDYLPMVGPVPDHEGFLRDYAALRKNARKTIDCKGDYVPGLFLSTAHGSRGLSSTPLAAELLASQICAESPPMERALCRALSPARFIIRDLGRNRI